MESAFIDEYGQQLFETLFSVIIGDEECGRIRIVERRKIDALNERGVAHINTGDETLFVEWANGDYGGSEIIDYGLSEITLQQYTTEYFFYPENDTSENVMMKYNLLSKGETWLTKKQRQMNYDVIYSPSDKTWNHYKDWARAKKLVIKAREVECI